MLQPHGIAALWPASGVALAAVLVATTRSQRVAAYLGIAVGFILANMHGRGELWSAVYFIPNLVETFLAAQFIRWCTRGEPIHFGRLRHVVAFVLGDALVGCVAGALLGATTTALIGQLPSFWGAWYTWYAADGMGMLAVTPALVGILRPRQQACVKNCLLEIGAALTIAGVSLPLFGGPPRNQPLVVLEFPFVVLLPLQLWMAICLSPRATALSGLAISLVSSAQLVAGKGPFAVPSHTFGDQILSLQLALMCSTLCFLMLSAIAQEWRSALKSARESAELASASEARTIQAVEAQAASEQKYRTVIENVRDVIFQCDAEGRYTLLNSAWTTVTGFDVTESLGKSFLDYVHPEDRLANARYVEALFRRDTDFCRHEVRYRTRDGQYRWMAVHAQAMFDSAGKLTGYSGSLADVTLRREAEDTLRAAKENAERFAAAAEATTRAKSEFLANMSHEIRTPMTAILGFTDLMSDDELPVELRRDYSQTIKQNGEHLLGLINDILDLSKIEANQMTMERIAFSPVQVIGEVETSMRVRALTKGIGFGVDYSGEVPPLMMGDPLRLRQILLNLVSNAIKFTETGEVSLSVRGDCREDGTRRLQIDVRDTGIGMSAAQIAQLFRPFTQADGSTTRRFGGTGLGLAISKRVAESMGATIEVSSEPGRGSVFSLCIDVPPQQAGAIDPAGSSETA